MDGSKEPVDAITIVVPTKMRKGESPFFYLQQHHSLHKGFLGVADIPVGIFFMSYVYPFPCCSKAVE